MSRPTVLGQVRMWWHSPLAKIALAGGVFIHLAGFLAFRVVAEPAGTVPAPEPFIRWFGDDEQSMDAVQREQAVLFDSEAIFLPTSLNAHHAADSLGLGNSDDVLLARASDTVIGGDNQWADGVSAATPKDSEVTAMRFLAQDATSTLVSIGQVAVVPAPEGDLAWAEVRDAYTGQVLGRYPLEGGAESQSPVGLEFMLYRTQIGTTGSLLPLGSATDEQVLRQWSDSIERADWQLTLPEGYYQIVVSP